MGECEVHQPQQSQQLQQLQQPYLNASLYRTHSSQAKRLPHLDFLHVASDGRSLVGRSDLTGRLWNGAVQIAESPEELVVADSFPDIATSNGLADGRFLRDSSKVVIGDDAGELTVWCKRPSWRAIAETEDRDEEWCVAFNAYEHDDSILSVDANADRIVTGGADNCIKVWDLSLVSVETYRPAHTHAVVAVSCHPIEDREFLSASLDGSVAVWDSKCSGSKAKVLSVESSSCRCVCWLTEKRFVVGYENGTVALYDTSQIGLEIAKVTLNFPIHKLQYNEKSQHLAVCGDSTKVYVYKVSEATELNLVYEDDRHSAFVRGLAWNYCEPIALYSCGWDSKIFKHSLDL